MYGADVDTSVEWARVYNGHEGADAHDRLLALYSTNDGEVGELLPYFACRVYLKNEEFLSLGSVPRCIHLFVRSRPYFCERHPNSVQVYKASALEALVRCAEKGTKEFDAQRLFILDNTDFHVFAAAGPQTSRLPLRKCLLHRTHRVEYCPCEKKLNPLHLAQYKKSRQFLEAFVKGSEESVLLPIDRIHTVYKANRPDQSTTTMSERIFNLGKAAERRFFEAIRRCVLNAICEQGIGGTSATGICDLILDFADVTNTQTSPWEETALMPCGIFCA